MSYLPHQISKGQEVADILRSKGVCYLAGLPRSGKTRTALYALSLLPIKRVLWLTKKQATPGIQKEIAEVAPAYEVTVTNYEQVTKLNKADYDFAVVDEAHNLGAVGKPTQRVKDIRAIALDKPVLLLSGTPSVESSLALFHQFCVTKHTPLKYKSFFEFFRVWGVPSPIWLYGKQVEQYKKAKPELLESLEPYFVRMTQDDAGITAKAEDVVHRIELSPYTLDLIAQALSGVMDNSMVFDSDAAIRMAVHQIEAGAVLYRDEVIHFANTELVDYIRQTFGDSSEVAVMCHFRSTRDKVAQHLPNVHVYSSDGHSEGVDLSRYKAFVIVNSGYSGAKFVQRRERGTRIDVTEPRLVHHLVSIGQLSERVYDAVSAKRDYNLAMFRKDLARERHTSKDFKAPAFDSELLGG